MADDDKPGKVVWEPGRAAAVTKSPVEAAAFLAQQLAEGRVKGVHLTLFLDDGQMVRAMFGQIHMPMLAWMAAYVTRDAMALNDGTLVLPGMTVGQEKKP